MKQFVEEPDRPFWYASHGGLRTDGYVLLAALLLDKPSESTLSLVRNLAWSDDLPESMKEALADLNHSGRRFSLTTVGKEFNRLFVGLGRGELVPYASWYREKMIQSAPLAAIRSDLARLGIIRQSECYEPEDHAGALCETMALLSLPANEIAAQEQVDFFNRHLLSWMPDFFRDLKRIAKNEFYRCVGIFGCCFMESEKTYQQLLVQENT